MLKIHKFQSINCGKPVLLKVATTMFAVTLAVLFIALVGIFAASDTLPLAISILGRNFTVKDARMADPAVQPHQDQKGEIDYAIITNQVRKNGYAFAGDKNVPLMKFSFKSPKNGILNSIDLSLDQTAKIYDLKNIQLYVNGVFIGERSFFEGKSNFQNLSIKFVKDKIVSVEARGTFSEQANVGDLVRLLLKHESAFGIISENGNKLALQANYPIRGNSISVIGRGFDLFPGTPER